MVDRVVRSLITLNERSLIVLDRNLLRSERVGSLCRTLTRCVESITLTGKLLSGLNDVVDVFTDR